MKVDDKRRGIELEVRCVVERLEDEGEERMEEDVEEGRKRKEYRRSSR